MNVVGLTASQLEQLADGLQNLAPAGTPPGRLPPVTAGFDASSIETEFCTIWPKAKPILQLVAQYIVWIPGAGAMAQTILNGLVTAGDAASGVLCPKPSGS